VLERISKRNTGRFEHFMGDIVDDDFKQWLTLNNFFTAPASTHYHGSQEGGLFEHSITVAKVLTELTNDNQLTWQRAESPLIIGMFHDLCKIDQYTPNASGKYDFNPDTLLKGHGDKSVMMLSSHMRLTEEEVMCIRYHMGAFTDKSEWNDYTRAVHKYPNVLWTHHADMITTHIFEI